MYHNSIQGSTTYQPHVVSLSNLDEGLQLVSARLLLLSHSLRHLNKQIYSINTLQLEKKTTELEKKLGDEHGSKTQLACSNDPKE